MQCDNLVLILCEYNIVARKMCNVKFESYMYRTFIAYMQTANGCLRPLRITVELEPTGTSLLRCLHEKRCRVLGIVTKQS